MKKRRIVLASLLKPVNEPRMFEKIGTSLAQSGQYEVHIVGYPAKASSSVPNLHFHPLPPFKRISIGRVAARLKALKFIIKVKPELLIVTTHELLGVAILIRILFGVKIIYDIQENYSRNIRYTNAFPGMLRPVIAFFVRLKEWAASPFFARFILAEKCFANELGFVGNKFLVIENKCRVPGDFARQPGRDFIELILTGTLAESTGVFRAIDLCEKLHALNPKIRLTLIGYCAQPNTLERIEKEVSGNSFIQLKGGRELVPHAEILSAIASANFGVVCYDVAPHTENRIPTKLFEYLACGLPIILQNHKPWIDMCEPFNAAIVVDFENPDAGSILSQLASPFYSTSPPLDSLAWASEEKNLLKLIDSIF